MALTAVFRLLAEHTGRTRRCTTADTVGPGRTYAAYSTAATAAAADASAAATDYFYYDYQY